MAAKKTSQPKETSQEVSAENPALYKHPWKKRFFEEAHSPERAKELEEKGYTLQVPKAPSTAEVAAQQTVGGVGSVTTPVGTSPTTGTPGSSANPTGTVTTTNG
jgi:hypothetical protein